MIYGFDVIFNLLFPIMFLFVFGIILYHVVKGIGTWNENNHSPRLTVLAEVVAKRMKISHHQQANAGDPSGAHGFHTYARTSYYVTFQVESGDRMELTVTGTEYGMLAEGDTGSLTFQGTRYLGFARE